MKRVIGVLDVPALYILLLYHTMFSRVYFGKPEEQTEITALYLYEYGLQRNDHILTG